MTTTDLVPSTPLPPDHHPARVFLAGLSQGSGRTAQRTALNLFARDLTNGACDAETLPWPSFDPSGPIKAAWRLGLVEVATEWWTVEVAALRRLPAQVLADGVAQLGEAQLREQPHGLLDVGDLPPCQALAEEWRGFKVLDQRVHRVASSPPYLGW